MARPKRPTTSSVPEINGKSEKRPWILAHSSRASCPSRLAYRSKAWCRMPTMTQPTLRSGGSLGELLEEVDVSTIGGSTFQELPELVYEEQDAIAWVGRSLLGQSIEQLTPRLHLPTRPASQFTIPSPRLLQSRGDISHGISTPTNYRNHQPAFPGWSQ